MWIITDIVWSKPTWTLLILTNCPSSWTMSDPAKGRPSLSQLRVGGGAPTAVHSSSSGLFTAMVSSSGVLDLEISGGSVLESRMFGLSCSWSLQDVLNLETTDINRLFLHYQAQWGWSSLCCSLLGYLPRSCRDQRLKVLHQAAAAWSPVHPARDFGEGKAAGYPSSTSVLEGEHPEPHKLMSLKILEPLWLAPLVQHDPHQGALQTKHTQTSHPTPNTKLMVLYKPSLSVSKHNMSLK